MKFKIDDKVRIKKDLEVGKKYGYLTLSFDMYRYKGEIAKITVAYEDTYKLDIDHRISWWAYEMLEPISRKIEDGLKEGDIIIDGDGDEKKVLGVCGKVVFLSYYNIFNETDNFYTLEELIKFGYTLKDQEAEPEEEFMKISRKDIEGDFDLDEKEALKWVKIGKIISDAEKKIKKLKEIK